MNNNNLAVHWSFWVIGIVALVWNLLGVINFLWQWQMSAEALAIMHETHRAIIEGRPIWATGGFGLAVFGGALGGLLLLLRKPAAIYLFIVSLLGVVVTMIHTIGIANSSVEFGFFNISMMILIPLVAGVFLIWYSMLARRKGWINRGRQLPV